MDKKECGGMCGQNSCGGMHGMGGCHHHGKHHLIKMILMMIIVIMIFASGFKLGEIVGSVRGSSYGSRGMMNRGGYGMMRGYNNLDSTYGAFDGVQQSPVK